MPDLTGMSRDLLKQTVLLNTTTVKPTTEGVRTRIVLGCAQPMRGVTSAGLSVGVPRTGRCWMCIPSRYSKLQPPVAVQTACKL